MIELDLTEEQRDRLSSREADAVRAAIAEAEERACGATIVSTLVHRHGPGGELPARLEADAASERATAEDFAVSDLRRALAGWVVYGTNPAAHLETRIADQGRAPVGDFAQARAEALRAALASLQKRLVPRWHGPLTVCQCGWTLPVGPAPVCVADGGAMEDLLDRVKLRALPAAYVAERMPEDCGTLMLCPRCSTPHAVFSDAGPDLDPYDDLTEVEGPHVAQVPRGDQGAPNAGEGVPS